MNTPEGHKEQQLIRERGYRRAGQTWKTEGKGLVQGSRKFKGGRDPTEGKLIAGVDSSHGPPQGL